jgi:hypothetical protein
MAGRVFRSSFKLDLTHPWTDQQFLMRCLGFDIGRKEINVQKP